jgi:hypothetical protein
MALKNIVKGICGTSRCKYDVYTKERTDELLEEKTNKSEVYLKDNYAVLENSIIFPAGEYGGVVNIEYPTGFTKNNCIPISIMYKHDGVWRNCMTYSYGGDTITVKRVIPQVELRDTITVRITLNERTETETTQYTKVVLMKIAE